MISEARKMSGINVWFIIEILSFYGYIISAMVFILEHSIMSTLGFLNKTDAVKDRFKDDFLAFHRKDCDWLAFVTILMGVNISLMVLNETAFVTERAKYGEPEI